MRDGIDTLNFDFKGMTVRQTDDRFLGKGMTFFLYSIAFRVDQESLPRFSDVLSQYSFLDIQLYKELKARNDKRILAANLPILQLKTTKLGFYEKRNFERPFVYTYYDYEILNPGFFLLLFFLLSFFLGILIKMPKRGYSNVEHLDHVGQYSFHKLLSQRIFIVSPLYYSNMKRFFKCFIVFFSHFLAITIIIQELRFKDPVFFFFA